MSVPGWNPARRSVLYALNRAACEHWHRTLLRTPHAMEYLVSRGFSDPEMIAAKYRIGYAPARSDSLPAFVWDILRRGFPGTEGKEDLERALEAAGLATRHRESGRLLDFMYGRLTFPIVDRGALGELAGETASIVGFGGRYVPLAAAAPGDDGPPKWLNTREGPIFSKRKVLYGLSWAHEVMRSTREITLLEGYLDVIQTREAGVGAVCATLGTSLTEDHIGRLVTSLRTRPLRVIVSTDDDAAGRASAERSASLIFALRPDAEVRIARSFDGLDPDDLILKHGAQAYRRVLDEALTPVQRHLRDLESEAGSDYKSLRSLVEFVEDVRGRLSPSVGDRKADLNAIDDWLKQHFGAAIPVHTLRRVLDETNSEAA